MTHSGRVGGVAASLGDDLAPQRAMELLTTQADLQYHAAPVRAVFNSPAATGMAFWSVNPYIGCAFGCAYCYARDTHRWALERAGDAGARLAGDMPPWLAFERRILVKENADALVRAAFRSTRAPRPGDRVTIGTATDPYQPAERRFGITRRVLEVLRGASGLRLRIITKSPLVTRDVDVLSYLATRHRLIVNVSLITLDRDLARRIEPRAPTPDARLRAVRRLSEAGIEVGVNCMPVLPGITDGPEAIASLVRAVADAGAKSFAACALRLRAASRRRYLPLVQGEWPELAARYHNTYGGSVYATDAYRAGLARFVDRLCKKHGLAPSFTDPDAEDDDASHSPPSQPPPQLELSL